MGFFTRKDADEKALDKFIAVLDRIEIKPQFIQSEDGLIRAYVLNIVAGERVITSNPIELQWPLQAVPRPTSMKGLLN